jgi:dTDP-glucose 4,6-dehydratase/UDP-glucose 4-epimerase
MLLPHETATDMTKRYLVTGGTGFIGAALVRRLISDGHTVRVLDNSWRGPAARLADLAGRFDMVNADIRDAPAVEAAARGVDTVYHLAYVNGTEFFYSQPELVLDVGIRGMLNVIDACRQHGVGELIVASSSEVYQTPSAVPTDETSPLVVPDVMNPRYSYGGGKILWELMAVNYGRKGFNRVMIFRPHNVYGPNMGWEHVLPQFVVRMKRLCIRHPVGAVPFPIQGTGRETRAFVFIDDFIDGLMTMERRGEHLGIYHIGNPEEVAIAEVARQVGAFFGHEITLEPSIAPKGATPRRCPDIAKLAALGYSPRVPLAQGLPVLARWYADHAGEAPPSLS